MKGMGGHHKPEGDKDEWITPKFITDAIQPIDLDPCSPVVPPWKIAAYEYNINDNGLDFDWDGFVFCNPPYNRYEIPKWLERMVEHNNGIALIFARTETENFFKYVWSKASAILFIEGRLFFHHVNGSRAKHNSGAPSCLVAYGE